MTKKELIEKLRNLPDDTVIYAPEYDYDTDVLVRASILEIDCDGSDGCEAEVTLI